MKFSLVAALVVVLAIAHGTESVSLVKHDVQAEVDKITRLISDMSTSITSATQDMVEKVKALEVPETAQTYVEDSRAQIQSLVERVQAEAVKLQEKVMPFVVNIDEQFNPLTDLLENFYNQMTKALTPQQQ